MSLRGESQTSILASVPGPSIPASGLPLPRGGAVPPFKLPWFRTSPFHVTARGPARAAPQLSSTLLPIVSL